MTTNSLLNHPANRNHLLSIFEAVAAFLVIFIHFPLPGITGNLVLVLARFSVPFFYAVSGYFFYKADRTKELKSIPKKIVRLFITVLIAELCYFSYHLLLHFNKYGIAVSQVQALIDSEFWGYYMQRLPEVLPIFSPVFCSVSWFMTSLIVVYAIMAIVTKLSLHKALFIGSPICIVVNLVLRHVLVSTDIPFERIIFLLPLPFFALGYWIRKNVHRAERISNKKYLIAILLATGILIVEGLLSPRHTLYWGTCLQVALVVAFASKNRNYQPSNVLSKALDMLGERHTRTIYLMHNLTGWILTAVIMKLFPGLVNSKVYAFTVPFYICLAVTIFSVLLFHTKRWVTAKFARATHNV